MTKRQIELVESSWDFIMLETDEAGVIFYNELFRLDPELRPLFKDDIEEQAHIFVSLITFVIHKLSDIDRIQDDVKALGIRHKNYNVKPEHYLTVGNALLVTLEKIMGNKWNEEIKEAWSIMYRLLSTTMIDAAERASS